MLAAIDFVSKAVFAEIPPAPDMVALSIGDPCELPPATLSRYRHSLRLEFLDIEPDNLHPRFHDMLAHACSREQVQQAMAWLSDLAHQPTPFRLVVHCHAGVSRSAAFALLAESLAPGCEFPRRADAFYANRHVLALACQLFNTTIVLPAFPQVGEPHHFCSMALQV